MKHISVYLEQIRRTMQSHAGEPNAAPAAASDPAPEEPPAKET